MRSHHSTLYPASRTYTYATITDDDAIKTSIATAATEQTYDDADLNGALANPGPALTRMQELTVSTTADAGTYNTTDPITATCLDQYLNTLTLTATLTDGDGNETVVFVDSDGNARGVHSVSSIVVPAQNNTNGAFTFGVRNVLFDDPCREIRGGATGNIVVEYEDDSGDTLPSLEGERHTVFAKQITSASTTALPVTVYL